MGIRDVFISIFGAKHSVHLAFLQIGGCGVHSSHSRLWVPALLLLGSEILRMNKMVSHRTVAENLQIETIANETVIHRKMWQIMTDCVALWQCSHSSCVLVIRKHSFFCFFVQRACPRGRKALVVFAKCCQAFSLVALSVSEEQMTAEPRGAGLIAVSPRLSALPGSHSRLKIT